MVSGGGRVAGHKAHEFGVYVCSPLLVCGGAWTVLIRCSRRFPFKLGVRVTDVELLCSGCCGSRFLVFGTWGLLGASFGEVSRFMHVFCISCCLMCGSTDNLFQLACCFVRLSFGVYDLSLCCFSRCVSVSMCFSKRALRLLEFRGVCVACFRCVSCDFRVDLPIRCGSCEKELCLRKFRCCVRVAGAGVTACVVCCLYSCSVRWTLLPSSCCMVRTACVVVCWLGFRCLQ